MQIWKIPDKYIFRTIDENFKYIINNLNNNFFVSSNPEDNAFLLNIRHNSGDYNIGVISKLVVSEKQKFFYVDTNLLDVSAKRYLEENNIEIKEYNLFDKDNEKFNFINNKSSFNISEYKSIKNDKELKSMISVYDRDKKLVDDFIDFVKDINFNKEHWTERMLEEELDNRRRKLDGFISLSFKTIMAYKESGANIHYDTNCTLDNDTSRVIKDEGFLMIDSGAHYLGGTTDMTRTILLGKTTDEEKYHYNLVKEAHEKLAQHIFQQTTTGYELDKIARDVINNAGLDYKHGTGHGVGYMLCVHEAPPTLTKKRQDENGLWGDSIIKANQIMSIEPGLYFENKYGIRLEDLYWTKVNADGLIEFVKL